MLADKGTVIKLRQSEKNMFRCEWGVGSGGLGGGILYTSDLDLSFDKQPTSLHFQTHTQKSNHCNCLTQMIIKISFISISIPLNIGRVSEQRCAFPQEVNSASIHGFCSHCLTDCQQ